MLIFKKCFPSLNEVYISKHTYNNDDKQSYWYTINIWQQILLLVYCIVTALWDGKVACVSKWMLNVLCLLNNLIKHFSKSERGWGKAGDAKSRHHFKLGRHHFHSGWHHFQLSAHWCCAGGLIHCHKKYVKLTGIHWQNIAHKGWLAVADPGFLKREGGALQW